MRDTTTDEIPSSLCLRRHPRGRWKGKRSGRGHAKNAFDLAIKGAWERVKDRACRGLQLHSDCPLYHAFVTELIVEAEIGALVAELRRQGGKERRAAERGARA